MSLEFEQGEANLRSLVQWYSEQGADRTRNESTTRLQLIDRLLFECLGWDRVDCKCEERLEGKFIDYSLYCPQCLAIVEAKREGVYFEVPTGSKKLKRAISFFLRHAEDVGTAIRQAMRYCQDHGTPFGIVCNGHQVVAFVATRSDGHPPLEGKALVFSSLQELEEEFLLAWACLSKYGVRSRRLSLELQDVTSAPPPEKLSARIPGYPGYKRRNDLQVNLQILADLFIEGIAEGASSSDQNGERDFLRHCHCKSGALSQYAVVSRDLLRSRYSALFQEAASAPVLEPATSKVSINPNLSLGIQSRRPILLIGDRGVGKTMFVKNLHKVEASDVFSEAFVIYVDFGSQPTLLDDVRLFVSEEIRRQLAARYGIDICEHNFVHGVLHKDLEQFEKGIYGDIRHTAPEMFQLKRVEFIGEKLRNKDEYLRLCLNQLSFGHSKQIVVFLDNVDQRPLEFQESVFLVGQAMASTWPATVFISIRPETFYRSKASGTLSAYHPRAFVINPPRVDEVVLKRLKYGIAMLPGLGIDQQTHVSSPNLDDYLKVVLYSFTENDRLIEFLDNICGGNIRLALDFVKAFVGSGHVDTQKILRIYRESGAYLVPPHEFLRAVTYGDHEYYSPSASEIVNLFDVSTPD